MSEVFNFISEQGEQFRRARLPSLYSDFTFQRSSNPDGYAANTAAWIEALTKAAQASLLSSDSADRDTLSLKTGETLLRSLETKEWGRPMALKTVIDEAVSQRSMLPYEEFITARKPIHNRNWTVQPWHLFSWGLKQLGLLNPPNGAGLLPTASFVILRNVEEAASKVVNEIESQSSQIDRILSMSSFSIKVSRILKLDNRLTERDLHILLTYLARDKSRIVYDTETVKFKAAGDQSSTLSTQDKTIASLKALITDIDMQIVTLSTRISSLSEIAQKAMNNKNRTSALAALRSKKLSEAILVQRSETLVQLEGAYSKIEQAADQVAVVRAMEASAMVLRNMRAQVGGVDKVEDVIEGLRDEMCKVDEMGGAIQAGDQRDSVFDESTVDEELESLERQANAREEEQGACQTHERLASISAIREEVKEIKQEPKSDTQKLSSDDRATYSKIIEEGINN